MGSSGSRTCSARVVYGPVTAQQVEAIGGIETSAKGLLELVDSLLFLARAEAQRWSSAWGWSSPVRS